MIDILILLLKFIIYNYNTVADKCWYTNSRASFLAMKILNDFNFLLITKTDSLSMLE